MTGGGYREFVDSDYTRLRKSLLAEKGSDRQADFLEATKRGDDFLKYLAERIDTQGSLDVELDSVPMTESEYTAPPSDTEARLYRSWSGVSPSVACRATFWGNVTRRHIQERRIQSAYLAANGANTAGGAVRIDMALHSKGKRRAKAMDDCVRTILRRLSGIPEQRGKRTVYVDCPLARAWWREWLVQQVSSDDQDVANQVRTVLRINQTYWEKIVDRIVSRNSTFGSRRVRSAFLVALAGMVDDTTSALRKPKELIRACRRVAAYQATRELSVLSEKELSEVMAEALDSV